MDHTKINVAAFPECITTVAEQFEFLFRISNGMCLILFILLLKPGVLIFKQLSQLNLVGAQFQKRSVGVLTIAIVRI